MTDKKYEHLKTKILPQEFKYVLFENPDQFIKAVDQLKNSKGPYSFFVTENEYSLICTNEHSLTNKKEEGGWMAMRIIGDMPFGSVQGLIANISSTLFQENIGVCVVSTFLTDFFFIRSKNLENAKALLVKSGWKLEQ